MDKRRNKNEQLQHHIQSLETLSDWLEDLRRSKRDAHESLPVTETSHSAYNLLIGVMHLQQSRIKIAQRELADDQQDPDTQ